MNGGPERDRAGAPPEQGPASSATERRIRMIDNQIESRDLFTATREITIAHGSDVYRLRLTALNKLILTK